MIQSFPYFLSEIFELSVQGIDLSEPSFLCVLYFADFSSAGNLLLQDASYCDISNKENGSVLKGEI